MLALCDTSLIALAYARFLETQKVENLCQNMIIGDTQSWYLLPKRIRVPSFLIRYVSGDAHYTICWSQL